MRLVIQRVKEASVTIEGKRVSEIGAGLFILVGVEKGDTEEDAKWLASKAAGLRIFDDNEGVMNRRVSCWQYPSLPLLLPQKRETVPLISARQVTSWLFLSTRIFANTSLNLRSALFCRGSLGQI